MATRSDVEAVNKGFYNLKASLQHAETQLKESRFAGPDLGNLEQLSTSATDLDPAAEPVVTALDHLLDYAFEQRASDIHFEPKREQTLVRLRIDGVLHDVHVIPKIVYEAVVSRIKLLCGCEPRGEAPAAGRPHQARAVDRRHGRASGPAGRSATVAEYTAGTGPFGPISVGDTILVTDRNGAEQRLRITAKTSDASVTVTVPSR